MNGDAGATAARFQRDSRSNFSVKHSDEERVYREYTTDERRSRSGCFTEEGRVRCVKEFSDGLLGQSAAGSEAAGGFGFAAGDVVQQDALDVGACS